MEGNFEGFEFGFRPSIDGLFVTCLLNDLEMDDSFGKQVWCLLFVIFNLRNIFLKFVDEQSNID